MKKRISREQATVAADAGQPAAKRDDESIGRILSLVRAGTAHDFGHYKRPTIERRIRRLQFACTDDVTGYLGLLDTDRDELNALYNDLLIR